VASKLTSSLDLQWPRDAQSHAARCNLTLACMELAQVDPGLTRISIALDRLGCGARSG
jgi:hypothetical protein